MTKNQNIIGFRKAMGYDDRNDGFMRSQLSRSKNDHSRNTKTGKIKRIKPEWKTETDYNL